MTKEELEAIGARAEAATEGPWDVSESEVVWAAPGVDATPGSSFPDLQDGAGEFSEADAAFISHARVDVPALLAYVAELEQDRNTYKACAESKKTLHETACAGRESAQKRVTDLEAVEKDAARVIAQVTDERNEALARVTELEHAIDDFITDAKVPQS